MESSQVKTWHKERLYFCNTRIFLVFYATLNDSGEKGKIKFQVKKQLLEQVICVSDNYESNR